MPKRSPTTATRAKPFPPAERVFHTVSADDFVRGSAAAPRGKNDGKFGVAPDVSTNSLRAGSLTSCCRRPVAEVYAVAISRASVQEGPGIKWCAGVTS